MYSKLVIDGNAVYEIDEECVQKKKNRGFKEGKRREEAEGHRKKRSDRIGGASWNQSIFGALG